MLHDQSPHLHSRASTGTAADERQDQLAPRSNGCQLEVNATYHLVLQRQAHRGLSKRRAQAAQCRRDDDRYDRHDSKNDYSITTTLPLHDARLALHFARLALHFARLPLRYL